MYESSPPPSVLDITVVKARIDPQVSKPQTSAWFIFSVDGCREPVSTPARPLTDPMMFGTPARFTFVQNPNTYLYVTLCAFDDARQMVPLARSRSRICNMPFGSQFSISLRSTTDKGKEIGQVYISGTLTQPQTDPQSYPGYADLGPTASNPYASIPQGTPSEPSSNPYASAAVRTPANPYGASAPANPYATPGQPNPYATPGQPNPYAAAGQPNPYATAGQPNPYAAAGQPNPYGAPAEANPYGAPGQPNPYGAPMPENPYQNAGMQGADGTKYFF